MKWEYIDLQRLMSEHGWAYLAEKGMSFGMNLMVALAIFFIGKWMTTRLVAFLKTAMTRAQIDATLVSFIGSVANIGLLVLVAVSALGQLGIPTTSLTALVGGAGLAIALSLKDQLSNFAAGALIILFRPFKVGDYIKVGGFEGFVYEIKMVQTLLRTYADEEVVLPNSVVMGNSIVNKSALPQWRSQVVVNVAYSADLNAAKAAVLKAATDHPSCAKAQQPPSVQVTKVSGGSVEITLWAWSSGDDWWAVQCDLNERVVENLRAAGIALQS